MSPRLGLFHQGCAWIEAVFIYGGGNLFPREQRMVSEGKDRVEEQIEFLANSWHPIFFFCQLLHALLHWSIWVKALLKTAKNAASEPETNSSCALNNCWYKAQSIFVNRQKHRLICFKIRDLNYYFIYLKISQQLLKKLELCHDRWGWILSPTFKKIKGLMYKEELTAVGCISIQYWNF